MTREEPAVIIEEEEMDEKGPLTVVTDSQAPRTPVVPIAPSSPAPMRLSPTLSFLVGGILTALSSIQVLLMTYTRRTLVFSSASVVLVSELVKLCGTIILYFITSPNHDFLLKITLTRESFRRGVWYALPAFFYAFSNNAMFLTLRLFEAYTVSAWLSTRIVFTGLIHVFINQQNLEKRKWAVLVFQTIFVIMQSMTGNRIPTFTATMLMLPLQALLTSSAAVMNEFLLKVNPSIDVNESNFWMYVWGVLFNTILGVSLAGGDPSGLLPTETNFWFYAMVINGALVGYVTSLVFKYLDVFMRNFAAAMSVGVTAILSAIFLGTLLHVMDIINISVITACILVWNGSIC